MKVDVENQLYINIQLRRKDINNGYRNTVVAGHCCCKGHTTDRWKAFKRAAKLYLFFILFLAERLLTIVLIVLQMNENK